MKALTDYECDCRDYILSVFEASPRLSIRKADLDPTRVLKLMRPKRLQRILRELAQLIHSRDEATNELLPGDWWFKEDEDLTFSERFPRLATKQRQNWLERRSALQEKLLDTARKGFPCGAGARKAAGRRRSGSYSQADGGAALAQGEGTSCSLTREAIAELLEDPLKHSPLDGTAKAVQAMLGVNGLSNKKFLSEQLQLKGLPTTHLDKVLKRVAMKVPSRELYVVRQRGNAVLDELRCIICHLYGGTTVLRRQDVRKAVNDSLGPDSKHAIGSRYSKAMVEFATSTGNRWHIRTGMGVE